MSDASFVVDASVTLAWSLEDETDPYADAVLDALAVNEALVPSVWPLEVGNGILVAERRSRMAHADAVQFLTLLQELPIAVKPEAPERMLGEIIALAREQGLSSYDASYLDLAMRLGLPLATQDEALRQAATRCGVQIYLQEKKQKG